MISCGTCRFHDELSSACCCGLSPKVADFTDKDDFCDEWERSDDRCREDDRNDDGNGQGSE